MLYKKKWPLFIFLVPGLLFLLIFLYIPFVENIKNSFYDMSSVVRMPGQEWEFIGLSNYKKLLTDPDVRSALINTVKMMVLTVIFEVGIAFVLAVMVSQIKKLQQLFRTVYFFPVVISATAIGLLSGFLTFRVIVFLPSLPTIFCSLKMISPGIIVGHLFLNKVKCFYRMGL